MNGFLVRSLRCLSLLPVEPGSTSEHEQEFLVHLFHVACLLELADDVFL